jgi:hypothetical protein
LEALNTKNASSTDYRFHCDGYTALDERTAGTVGTDPFDDLGHIDTNPPAGNVLIGTGNIEQAVKVRKTGDAPGVEEFVGGTHGFEGAPASLVYKVSDSTIDFAGGSLNAEWTGTSFGLTFTTTLKFPSDSSTWATNSWSYLIDRGGYRSDFTRTTSATAVIYEDYAAMLMMPNRSTSNIGYAGGVNFGFAKPFRTRDKYPAESDETTIIPRADKFQWYNGAYLASLEMLDWPEVLEAYGESITASGLTRVQTRTDKYIKVYQLAKASASAGTTVNSGQVLTARKLYRITLR